MGLPVEIIPGILKPALGNNYNGEDRSIDKDISTTYATTYQRSQVTSPGGSGSGAVKKKEKLRKRRHRLAQTDDGQAVAGTFADAEPMHSPLSSIMEFSAAVSPGLTGSRPSSSLQWVQEDVAGKLMNPRGKGKGQKEDSRSNKKRKQQQQPADKRIDMGEGGRSRGNLYVSQTWEEATAYGDNDDKDVVTEYSMASDNNSSRRHSATMQDLDHDATTGHSARPQQEIARVKHNKVEQKYRNRLNAHFEALLDVLPPSAALPSEEGFTADSDITEQQPESLSLGRSSTDTVELVGILPEKERRVSKSEVLDRARLYIQALENEHKRLAAERKQLRKVWDEYGKADREG